MAIEVTELSPVEPNIRPPINLEKWRKKESIENEFNNTDGPTLQPLKSVKISIGREEHGKKVTEERDFDPLIQKDFAYYSRTRDLEVNTPRTQLLQNLVDKMTAGTDIQARVVIMKKGKEHSAFVAPDGTIFISQSILNSLNSIDEIGAILAHEVGHLHLRTFERMAQTGRLLDKAAIAWVHEGVSDSLAKEFGEKAGLNTFAFGPAIEKISGASRGLEHQGGYMRSSQNVAEHSARHYETSAKAVEPVPIMLLGRVRPTNLEIIKDRIDKRQSGHFKEDLAQLHPRDLQEAYQGCLENMTEDEKYHQKHYPQSFKLLEQFNQLLKERLIQAGYSEAQTLAWFTRAASHHNRYLFKNLEDPVRVAQVIVEVSKTDEGLTDYSQRSSYFKKMSQTVFEEGGYVDSLTSFLDLLENYLYDESAGQVAGGIPVNRQSILEILANLSTLKLYSSEKSQIGSILAIYIEDAFYKNATESGEEIDTEQIVDFLDEAKEMGIEIDQWMLTKAADRLTSLKKGLAVDTIEVQNYQKLVDTLRNYFGQKEWQPFADINKEIDTFFQSFSEERDYSRCGDQITNFLIRLRTTFEYQNLGDAERAKFVKYLSAKFDSWSGFTKYSVRDALERIPRTSGDTEENIGDPEENAKLARLQVRTILGLALFKQDGEEFYQFLDEAIKSSNIVPASFSKVGLVNLCGPLLLAIKGRLSFYDIRCCSQNYSNMSVRVSHDHVDIKNFERLTSLSIISEILSRTEKEDLSSWDKLRTSVITLARRLDNNAYGACNFPDRERYSATKEEHFDIFSDSALTLILFQDHRQAFLDLINQGVKEEDLGSLYQTLTTIFPNETRRSSFLRAIEKRFLMSGSISLEKKTEYLLANLESLGPEGVLMVADQINTLADYQKFREKLGDKLEGYLNGGDIVLKGLAADLVTSLLSEGFEKVIQTTIDDPETAQEASTDFVTWWFRHNLNLKDLESIGYVRYDPEEKRFITGEKSRVAFRSIADIFSLFKNLTHTQRFLTLHKALADVNGALSAPDHRKKLAGLVTKALKLGPGFVHDIIKTACLIGEPRLVSFPAANMLSPMLFRAFDVNRVDFDKVFKWDSSELEEREGEPIERMPWKDFLTTEDARRIVNSTTRQLTVFGSKFTHQPNSYFYSAAQQSDLTYQKVSDGLENQLLQEVNGQAETAGKVNPSIEAIVKGVEASGALGVRSLQLATQLLKFSPEVARRLSDSFDSNPGMRKLIFWERLYRQTQIDPQLLSFLNSIEIGGYLGGGSLFTTYAAKRRDPATGQEREIVVKALNTNAEGFIEQYYSMAIKVLKEVEKNRSNHGFAKAARLLLDISQEWCKADIHDPDFAQDDDNFQKTIQNFNNGVGREVFYAPRREFSNIHIKVEDLAQGPTLNRFLNNDKVSPNQKKEMVATLMRFFAFQFKHALPDQSGGQFYLFHSDPHVGNYIVTNGETNPKLAVIDRSMYLKLKKEDVEVLQNLLTETNSTRFVNQFVTLVLDEKGITNNLQRRAVWFQVWSALGRELGSQLVRGGVDNFSLLRTMLSELDNAGCRAPLNLRLMIRNIGAFKELGGKFGLKLEDYM